MIYELLKETNVYKIIIKVVSFLFFTKSRYTKFSLKKAKRFQRINNDFTLIIFDALSIIILN